MGSSNDNLLILVFGAQHEVHISFAVSCYSPKWRWRSLTLGVSCGAGEPTAKCRRAYRRQLNAVVSQRVQNWVPSLLFLGQAAASAVAQTVG